LLSGLLACGPRLNEQLLSFVEPHIRVATAAEK
jgi:hypothetical protein